VGSHRAQRPGRGESGRGGRIDTGRFRRAPRPAPVVSTDPLARFAGGTLTDPTIFGGGTDRADVVSRVQTVAYGYLGVVEGYRHPQRETVWSTLTVTLPCLVPTVVIDHRSVLGRPGVAPAGAWCTPVGVASFDEEYVVRAPDSLTVATMITPALCQVLSAHPVQRLTFDRRRLLLRTFDGSEPTPLVIERLDRLAADVLAATPAFVMRAMGSAAPDSPPEPFPPGLYG
jgi:hypothetical protein